jgi:hypothetical protein
MPLHFSLKELPILHGAIHRYKVYTNIYMMNER